MTSFLSRLMTEDPKLAENYSNNGIVLCEMLKKYRKRFPASADYTILRVFDVMEICENLLGEENGAWLSAEDLYVLMMAVTFQYIGLGEATDEAGENGNSPLKLEAELENRGYVKKSIRMLRSYHEIFEIPSQALESRILTVLETLLSEEASGLNGKEMGEKEICLAAWLHIADALAELVNRNMELTREEFPEYSYSEIRSCVAHLSVESLQYDSDRILVKLHGSKIVHALFMGRIRKIDHMVRDWGDLIRKETEVPFPYTGVQLELLPEEDSKDPVFLNPAIEQSWTREDHEAFEQFSEQEKEFYLDYLSAEYGLTKQICTFAESHSAQLMGLEHRVKSPRSVYGKLHKNARKKTLQTLSDTIRYTIVSEPEIYVENLQDILASLFEEGWDVLEVENFWRKKNLPYNGVNVQLQKQNLFITELQFHTPESFDVKMSKQDHELYEKRRLLPAGSPEYEEILKEQFRLYEGMKIPEGIDTVG